MSESGHFIGIDWGTTNARAMNFGADGRVLAERDEPLGGGRIAAGGFPAAFAQLTFVKTRSSTGCSGRGLPMD